MTALAHSPARDRAWGRYYARRGAARVLRDAERPATTAERVLAWRMRAGEPGIGNRLFATPAAAAAASGAPPLDAPDTTHVAPDSDAVSGTLPLSPTSP